MTVNFENYSQKDIVSYNIQRACSEAEQQFKNILLNEFYLIYFKRPVLLIICKNPEGVYEATIDKNEDLKGFGENKIEAINDLVTAIYGAWILANMDEEQLHESAIKLKKFLEERIKDIKEF